MKKSWISLVMLTIVLTTMVFTVGWKKEKGIKIKIASMQAEGTPETDSIHRFKELVEKRSSGDLVVEVYPNNQLGSPETYIDSTRQGNIEMCVPGTTLSVYQPLVAVPEMPFLFRDWQHVEKALTDPYVRETINRGVVEKIGLRNLGINPLSHGNGNGIGLADLTTVNCIRQIDLGVMYTNSITARVIDPVRLPLIANNAKEALATAIKMCVGVSSPQDARIVRIKNTNELDTIYISKACLDDIERNGKISVLQRNGYLNFDETGELI